MPSAEVCGDEVDNDCDDANPAIRPTVVEVCNGIDDNCNLLIDDDDLGEDTDGDTVRNRCDNCPQAPNLSQQDTDGDVETEVFRDWSGNFLAGGVKGCRRRDARRTFGDGIVISFPQKALCSHRQPWLAASRVASARFASMMRASDELAGTTASRLRHVLAASR